MAKQTVTRTLTKERKKKVPEGNLKCNLCGGKGYVKRGYNKKKS